MSLSRTSKKNYNNLKSLKTFIDEKFGGRGTEDRERFEVEYQAFKRRVIRNSRLGGRCQGK